MGTDYLGFLHLFDFGARDAIEAISEYKVDAYSDLHYDSSEQLLYVADRRPAQLHVLRVTRNLITPRAVLPLEFTESIDHGAEWDVSGLSSDGKFFHWGHYLIETKTGKVLDRYGPLIRGITSQLVICDDDLYELPTGRRVGRHKVDSKIHHVLHDDHSLWSIDDVSRRLKQFSLDPIRKGLTGLASDEDGDNLTLELLSTPQNGTLVQIGTDGEFQYKPNEGFVGEDTFRYRVSDGTNLSAVQTVTIAVFEPLRSVVPHADKESYRIRAGSSLYVGQESNPKARRTFQFPASDAQHVVASELYQYFAMYTSNGVEVRDLSTGALVDRYLSSRHPFSLRSAEDGRFLFFVERKGEMRTWVTRYDALHQTWLTKPIYSTNYQSVSFLKARDIAFVDRSRMLVQMEHRSIDLLEFSDTPFEQPILLYREFNNDTTQLLCEPSSGQLLSHAYGEVHSYQVKGNTFAKQPQVWQVDSGPYPRAMSRHEKNLYLDHWQYDLLTGKRLRFGWERIMAATSDFAVGQEGIYSAVDASLFFNFATDVQAVHSNGAGTTISTVDEMGYSRYEISNNQTGVLENDSDELGRQLLAEFITKPSSGDFSLSSNGAFHYTPSLGFSGTDWFEYRVRAGDSVSQIVRVDLVVEGDWHNDLLAIDVTGDGWVTPIDAFFVIHALNAPEVVRESLDGQLPFLDVNDDKVLSPVDALIIINSLNQQTHASGESNNENELQHELDLKLEPSSYWYDFWADFLARERILRTAREAQNPEPSALHLER